MHWVFGRCSVVTPITSHHNTTCRHVGRADGRPFVTPARLPALEGFKGGLIYVVGDKRGKILSFFSDDLGPLPEHFDKEHVITSQILWGKMKSATHYCMPSRFVSNTKVP